MNSSIQLKRTTKIIANNSEEVLKDGELLIVKDGNNPPNLRTGDGATQIKNLKDIVPGVPGTNFVLDNVYPIGSIYMNVNSTNPETLFGGTWEQIQGRFLLGMSSSYPAGSQGGEASHTLTTEEMPSHGHNPADEAGYYGFITDSKKAFTVGDMGVQSGSGRYYPYAPAAFDISRNTKTGSVGGGKSHNNMPPYLSIYIWKRIA